MRLAADARILVLVGALGTLLGCAAPAPPQPPSPARPATGLTQTGTVKPGNSSPAASPAGEISSLSAPRDLVAVPVRSGAGALEVDLSWAISDAANLAGYNVYRSQQPGERGARLNQRVLAVPEFRDATASAGVTYRYSVTAVGMAGNESPPSAPVTVSIPATGRGTH